MNKASIWGSEINGDVNVGDQTTYVVNPPPADPTAITRALARFQALNEEDEEFKQFIERLDFFTDQKSLSPTIGLEKKLLNGDREDLVDIAIERKDAFAKILLKTQLTRRRQGIFLFILQKISFGFEQSVRPLLKKGAPDEVVDGVILNHIINPIYTEIMGEDFTIDQYMISGMLYFLTGKCHLVWERPKC
ncbi:ABC-three component system protein [Pseudomonas plecoglossicida]|uniref:ABC-three component system protein n=1 Tax=Pseudomonas plecoglossicida TaxID=70775 RepID=UPI0039779C88